MTAVDESVAWLALIAAFVPDYRRIVSDLSPDYRRFIAAFYPLDFAGK